MLHVCLHGFSGSPGAWDDVTQSMDGPVLTPWLPGHGTRAPPTRDATFEQVADAIFEAVHSAAPQPAHWVGYSLGARLLLCIALRHARHLQHVTLIGCNPGLESDVAARAAGDARWERMLRTEPLATFVHAWSAQPLFASQAKAEPARLAAQEHARLSHDAHALADMLHATSLARMPNLWPQVENLQVPSTWVAGGDDPKFTRIATRAAALAPGGELRIIAAVGHNPLLESPQAVAEVMRAGVADRPNNDLQTPSQLFY